jgi:MYXO-CTERM domain-containing protein
MSKHLIAAAAALAAFGANAALTAGDIAIIGRTNNTTPDAFSFVALSNIAAGESIYFTDNGWTGTGYRGAAATDGDGSENLARWTATSAVAAGTIISSTNANFASTSTVVGTGVSQKFGNLDFATAGDQINAFQTADTTNPLFNVANQTALFAFDDTNGFEAASTSNTGGIPTGLTQGSTAVSVNFATGGTISVKASVLATLGNDKTAWLAAISNTANWATATALPTGSISVASIPVTPSVPEPESYALALASLGLFGALARRRSR